MGRVLRPPRLHHDAGRPAAAGLRRGGGLLLRRTPARRRGLRRALPSARRGAAARPPRGRATREPGSGEARASVSRPVPMGLQPLQAARGCPSAAGPPRAAGGLMAWLRKLGTWLGVLVLWLVHFL